MRKQAVENTKGKAITQIETLAFKEELKASELQEMKEVVSETQVAVEEALTMVNKVGIQEMIKCKLSKGHSMAHELNILLLRLPMFAELLETDPYEIVNLGIWGKLPDNLDEMQESDRYIVGRQVLAKLPVESNVPSNAGYMVPKEGAREKWVTHKTRITSVEGNDVTLNDTFKVKLSDLKPLNDPHKFYQDQLGNLQFEDDLRCDYSSKSVQLKLLHIMIALRPLVERLDFSKDCLAIQLEAIRTIRRCIDIITFNKGEEKIVIAERHKTGGVGQTGLFGQGNCHGCSSTMAAYLLPFCDILGIDLKYRGGYSFHKDMNDPVSNVDRHQWLEVTCRPSMETFVLDLWYEGVRSDSGWLTMPIDEAYQTNQYPNGKLIIKTTI